MANLEKAPAYTGGYLTPKQMRENELKYGFDEASRIAGDKKVGVLETIAPTIGNVLMKGISSTGNVIENAMNPERFADNFVKTNKDSSIFQAIGSAITQPFSYDATPDITDKLSDVATKANLDFKREVANRGSTLGSDITGLAAEAVAYLPFYKIGAMSNTRIALNAKPKELADNVTAHFVSDDALKFMKQDYKSELRGALLKDATSNALKLGAVGTGVGAVLQEDPDTIAQRTLLDASVGFVGTAGTAPLMRAYDFTSRKFGGTGVDAPLPTATQKVKDKVSNAFEIAKPIAREIAADILEVGVEGLDTAVKKYTGTSLKNYVVDTEGSPKGGPAVVTDKTRTMKKGIKTQEVVDPKVRSIAEKRRLEGFKKKDEVVLPGGSKLQETFTDTGGRQYASDYLTSHLGGDSQAASLKLNRMKAGQEDAYADDAMKSFDKAVNNLDAYGKTEAKIKSTKNLSDIEKVQLRDKFESKLYNQIADKVTDDTQKQLYRKRALDAEARANNITIPTKDDIDNAVKSKVENAKISEYEPIDYSSNIKTEFKLASDANKNKAGGTAAYHTEKYHSLSEDARGPLIAKAVIDKVDKTAMLKASDDLKIKAKLAFPRENLDINNIPDNVKYKFPQEVAELEGHRNRLYDVTAFNNGEIKSDELAFRESKRLDKEFSAREQVAGKLTTADEVSKFGEARTKAYDDIMVIPRKVSVKSIKEKRGIAKDKSFEFDYEKNKVIVNKRQAVADYIEKGILDRYSKNAERPFEYKLSLSEKRDIDANPDFFKDVGRARILLVDKHMPNVPAKDVAKTKEAANIEFNTLLKDYNSNKLGLTDKENVFKIKHSEETSDAVNSVAALISVITGDVKLAQRVFKKADGIDFRETVGNHINKADDGFFENLKGSAVSKDDVKTVYTPDMYGSMEKGTAEAALADLPWLKTMDNANKFVQEYYSAMAKEVPAIGEFAKKMDEVFKANTTGKFSWTLPDGKKVEIELSGYKTYNIVETSGGKTKTIGKVNIVNGTKDEFSKALMPRFIHSIDAWIARTIRKDLNLQTKHDAITYPKEMRKEVDAKYRSLMKQLQDEDFGNKAIKELSEGKIDMPRKGNLDKIFKDKSREFLKVEDFQNEVKEIVKKPWSEMVPATGMTKIETMISYMTTMTHRNQEHHTIVDAMIDEIVHTKVSIPKAGDDVFERQLALAIQGKGFSEKTMIPAPDGVSKGAWKSANEYLYNRFRAGVEYNPNLKSSIKGDRQFFTERGYPVGTKMSGIREIRNKLANDIMSSGSGTRGQTASEVLESGTATVKSIDEAITSGKPIDIPSEQIDDAIKTEAGKFDMFDEEIRKVLEEAERLKNAEAGSEQAKQSFSEGMKSGFDKASFAGNAKRIFDFFKSKSGDMSPRANGIWKSIEDTLDKVNGFDIIVYNKVESILDDMAEKNPAFAEMQTKWRESHIVDEQLSALREASKKYGETAYDGVNKNLNAEHKGMLKEFLDSISDTGKHLKNKYEYSKEHKTFSKILGITTPSKKLADEAGDRLTKHIQKLLKDKNQDEYMRNVFFTDAIGLRGIKSKAEADVWFADHYQLYSRMQKHIDASADGVGRGENQRGFYANNASVIAEHYNLKGYEDIIDQMISIKAMDNVDGWEWYAKNVDTAEVQDLLSIAKSMKDRSTAIFAFTNDLNLMQKGYIQDSFDNPKIWDNKMKRYVHDADPKLEAGALGFDSMSAKVGEDVKGIKVTDVANPYEYAEKHGLKVSARGFMNVADLETRTKMGLKRDLAMMLGNTEATLRRKDAQLNTFTEILTHSDDTFKSMFSKNKQDGFVKLSLEESYRLPKFARDEIVYVNKEFKDKLIGRNEFSLSNADTSYGLKVADRLLKDTVSIFKQSNVLKNLSSFKNAFLVSYSYHMLAHGNPMKALRYNKDAIGAWREFKAITAEFDLATAQGKLTPELIAKYRDNEAVQMLKDGLSINTLDGVRTNGSMLNNMLSELTGGHLDRITNEIMFNQNAITGGFAKDAFSYLDFQARYMMYRGFKDSGSNNIDAMMRTNDMFGQMDEIAPVFIDAIDKYGLAVFAKWAASVLPAVAKTVKHNPLKAAAIALSILYLSDETNTHLSSVSPVESLVDMPYGFVTGDGALYETRNIHKLIPGVYRDLYKQGAYYMDDEVVRNPITEPDLLWKDRLAPYRNSDGEYVDNRGVVQMIYDAFASDEVGEVSDDKQTYLKDNDTSSIGSNESTYSATSENNTDTPKYDTPYDKTRYKSIREYRNKGE